MTVAELVGNHTHKNMAYFPDLSPYAYAGYSPTGVLHVGWLDNIHPFAKGTVTPHLVEKMKVLAANPTELKRGFHICELCSEKITRVPVENTDPRYNSSRQDRIGNRFFCPKECMSNGEIRVTLDNMIFAPPVLIIHYIEAHGYLAPQEFLNAVKMHRME
jgi:hypothetical protein